MSAPKPSKLLIGLLSADPALFSAVERALARDHGPVDLRSEILQWKMTRYYEKEMGAHLLRQFMSFERLISPAALAHLKLDTNRLEWSFASPPTVDGARRLNIDPGYLDANKLILASTKDQAHRIYLSQGIYAEVTLRYHHGAFHPFDYTYPDYCWPQTQVFLKRLRQRYLEQLRKSSGTR